MIEFRRLQNKKINALLILYFVASLLLSIFAFLLFDAKNVLCKNLSEEIFFVGEDVRVLTIASRRPEAPDKAPAIAEVITADELRARGVRTLGEALSYVPGFYVGIREWGSMPFLRGVPNGILFLYDGVPLTSDSTKSIHPLDEELSLEAISRIEIIRGPGSVLWGPDAFAGIVNIVPKKGAEAKGLETGLLLGSPFADRKAWFNLGHDAGLWQGFLSFSAYNRDPDRWRYAFQAHHGSVGHPEFYELVFNFKLRKFLYLSGRVSEFRRPFVMSEMEEGLSWPGVRKTPLSFIKLEAEKRFQKTSLRFKGYYSYLNQKHRELEVNTQQKNHLFYGEVLVDQELWAQKGLLTLGVSWRKNWVRDATINVRGFLPEYLAPENPQFSPLVDIADFDTRLFSLFLQYRHHLSKNFDFWAGVRLDDHDQYTSSTSYNLGLNWTPRPEIQFKLLHGTAYRTPYSAQFLRESDLDPEKIMNFSLEALLKPREGLSLRLAGFYNRIEDHVGEDPFGGFSFPTKEKFLGLEGEFSWKVSSRFSTFLNFTLFSRWGEKEHYRVLDYIIITPGGTRPVYSDYEKDFTSEAKNFGNWGFSWQLRPSWRLFWRFSYLGRRKLRLLKTGESYSFPRVITADMAFSYEKQNFSAQLALKNLFDQDFKVPGTLAPIEAAPFRAYFILRFKW